MWAGCNGCNAIGPWFTLQWQVGGVGADGSLVFAPGGGTQGSEGWKVDGPTGAWFVENALELLDEENEFYHDTVNSLLYWAPNASDASATEPPDADALIAVRGKVLLSVTGSQQQPVKNVTLSNLIFRDAAPTFLDAHDMPSQGDWSLVHTAAVVANGTEDFTMQACLVTRVDGQGLLLEGYHRNAKILRNDFEWIGSHAMVSWGKTSPCLNEDCSRQVPNVSTSSTRTSSCTARQDSSSVGRARTTFEQLAICTPTWTLPSMGTQDTSEASLRQTAGS